MSAHKDKDRIDWIDAERPALDYRKGLFCVRRFKSKDIRVALDLAIEADPIPFGISPIESVNDSRRLDFINLRKPSLDRWGGMFFVGNHRTYDGHACFRDAVDELMEMEEKAKALK